MYSEEKHRLISHPRCPTQVRGESGAQREENFKPEYIVSNKPEVF